MSNIVNDIVEFLRENPDYEEILKRIVQWEEENCRCKNCGSNLKEIEKHRFKCEGCGEEQWVLGLQWFDLSEPVAKLNRLVFSKILRVTFKTRSGTHYMLCDRDKVKQALRIVEASRKPVPAEAEEVEMPNDLFSVIVGYDDVKELIKRALHQDKPVGFLLVGPVATAKSLFLEELNRVPGSSYHLGSSSTKAGLTQFLLDVRPRLLLIDELDKMRREDLAALLSLMESGKVVETKFGRRREEYMKIWVFASCNSLKGIPPENVSRFKPCVFHFREYTKEEFIQVVEKFLVERESVDPNLAKYIAEKVSAFTRDVRAARGLGRLCKTVQDVDQYAEIIGRYKGFSSFGGKIT